MPESWETSGQYDCIRFAAFELDLKRGVLSRDGIPLKLQPQPFRVLVLLLTSAPAIVSREQIRNHVWGDRQYIEADQSINFCIRQIRSVLCDSSAEPRFLQTIPREGYWFIAHFESVENLTKQQGEELAIVNGSAPQEQIARFAMGPWDVSSRRRWAALLILIAAVSALTAFIYLRFAAPTLQVYGWAAITNESGLAQDPALGPDKTAIAFAWTQENDGVSHICVKGATVQEKFALTHGEHSDRYPVWSPDGKTIAFARVLSQTELQLMTVPAQGGDERVLRTIHVSFEIAGAGRPLAWTGDGRYLCFADQLPDGSENLFLLSPQTGEVKPLQKNDAGANRNESGPAFSADGHSVAITQSFGPVNTQIVLQRLDKRQQAIGQPVVISGTGQNPTDLVWLGNRRLAFLDGEGLMQASWEHPAATQIFAANMELSGLEFDPLHRRFITSQSYGGGGIWVLPLKNSTATGAPRSLLESLAGDGNPAFSPDGKSLAFVTGRSGAVELWLADADGQAPRQLTHLSAYLVGYPRWSPDSKLITFHARVPRVPQLYIFRLEDQSLRVVTGPDKEFVAPSFSSDGRKIYCTQITNRGAPQITEIDLQDGSRKALWPGDFPFEAPGRSTLVYTDQRRPGLYERSLLGDPVHNQAIHLSSDPVPSGEIPSVTGSGIFYVIQSNQGELLRFYSFAKKRAANVVVLNSVPGPMLSLRPDGKSLAYENDSGTKAQLVALSLR